MTRKLRIGIASAGRFHVLDLARELHALGHEVKFYSYVPRARAAMFGLPKDCHVALLPRVAPFLAWQKVAPQLAPTLRERLAVRALDRAVIATLQPCDVFIAMSGIYLEALAHARHHFSAKTILVRASKHILAQDEILSALPNAERPSPLIIERELQGYATADRIDIPSSHAFESFARDPALSRKLILNPYGADLEHFPPYERAPRRKRVRFVYAGIWSLRKGCDLLTEAILRSDAELLHIGPIGDLPFPSGHENIKHLKKVDQSKLSEIYREVDAFVLASREDGFGLVLAQALATGLPILCTTNTGGPDLRFTPALTDRITVVDVDSPDAITRGIASISCRLTRGPAFRPISERDRRHLSWEAYGQRYEDNLLRLFEAERSAAPSTTSVKTFKPGEKL